MGVEAARRGLIHFRLALVQFWFSDRRGRCGRPAGPSRRAAIFCERFAGENEGFLGTAALRWRSAVARSFGAAIVVTPTIAAVFTATMLAAAFESSAAALIPVVVTAIVAPGIARALGIATLW